jgi:hypothetical protein
MGTIKNDLMTVARASWTIGCDDDHYETTTREAAVDLWMLAIEMLKSYERRRAKRGSRSADEIPLVALEGPTETLFTGSQARGLAPGGPS